MSAAAAAAAVSVVATWRVESGESGVCRLLGSTSDLSVWVTWFYYKSLVQPYDRERVSDYEFHS